MTRRERCQLHIDVTDGPLGGSIEAHVEADAPRNLEREASFEFAVDDGKSSNADFRPYSSLGVLLGSPWWVSVRHCARGYWQTLEPSVGAMIGQAASVASDG